MTQQSREWSLIETCTGTSIGFSVAVVANYVILPIYNMHPNWEAASWVAVWFTVISLIRGYLVRRLFNAIHVWQDKLGLDILKKLKEICVAKVKYLKGIIHG